MTRHLLLVWAAATCVAARAQAPPPPSVAPVTTTTPALVPAEYVSFEDGPLVGVRALRGLVVDLVAAREGDPRLAVDGELGPAFEVLDDGTALLLAGGAVVTARGAPVVTANAPITSFAREPGGDLLIVAGHELGAPRDGRFVGLVELPGPGFHVAIGADGAIYLHDPTASEGSIYLVRDVSQMRLVDAGLPIAALAITGRRVFFALDGAIYSAAPRDATAIVFHARSFAATSLAHASRAALLLASDGARVLAIRGGQGVALLEGLGGVLRVVEEPGGTSLYVLARERRLLLRVQGLERLATPR